VPQYWVETRLWPTVVVDLDGNWAFVFGALRPTDGIPSVMKFHKALSGFLRRPPEPGVWVDFLAYYRI
jgi:hypothetical protein